MALVLTISLIGMALISATCCIIAGKAIQDQAFGRISQETAVSAGKIDNWIYGQIRYFDAMATGLASRDDLSPESVYDELVAHGHTNEAYFAVYLGYPDGTGVFDDDWEPDYNEWRANERDWYIGSVENLGKVYLTEMYIDATTGNYCITFAKAIVKDDEVVGVVAADVFTDVLVQVVYDSDIGKDSAAILTDDEGAILAFKQADYMSISEPSEEDGFDNMTTIQGGAYAALMDDKVKHGGITRIKGADGTSRYYAGQQVSANEWHLFTAIPVRNVDAPIYNLIIASAVVFIAVLICSSSITYFRLRKLVVKPVKDVTEAANILTQGETGVRLDGNYVGELAQLAESFRNMDRFNSQQTEWIERIATGDLAFTIEPRGPHDRTGHAVNSMLESLNQMFSNIQTTSTQVETGSNQIADGAQHLAHGAGEQNVAIMELSTSIGEIANKTEGNSEKAAKAAEISNQINDYAKKSAEQMNHLILAVREITEASRDVNNVINLIDDIAFQTNILALNAAVEAARAGLHGKGFSVVADEVRNLAAKSAEAASTTGDLIENTISKSALGEQMAADTAESLAKIDASINESTSIFNEIARSSEIQTEEIKKIKQEIFSVTNIVQQNYATAEESAAASEELNHQSEELNNQISQFKLSETEE